MRYKITLLAATRQEIQKIPEIPGIPENHNNFVLLSILRNVAVNGEVTLVSAKQKNFCFALDFA